MSIRSFFGGLLIIAGSASTVLFSAAMLLSMQLDSGSALLIGLAGLGGGLAALASGGAVLLIHR